MQYPKQAGQHLLNVGQNKKYINHPAAILYVSLPICKVSFNSILRNGSRVKINIRGDNGHPCLVPFLIGKLIGSLF